MTPAPRRLLPALLCFAVALALYLLTLAPGVQWGDHAELQLAAARPELGVGVRSYPLWTVLATAFVRVFALDPALGANLLSAVFGAVSVLLCVVYVQTAFRSPPAAWFAGLSLTVSHLLWSSSTVAEVYSLAACFLFLLLLAGEYSLTRIRRGALLLGLVAGTSLLHHRMIQLAALCLLPVLIVLWHRRGTLSRGLCFGLLGTVLGALPMLALFRFVDHPGGFGERAATFLLGGFGPRPLSGLGLGSGLLGLLLYGLRFIGLNLAGPQGLTLLLAFRSRRRPGPGSRALPFAFLVAALPVLLHFPHVGDRFVLILPAICGAVVLSAVAAADLPVRPALRVLLPLLAFCLPPLCYGTLAATDLAPKIGMFRGASPIHRREFLWPGRKYDDSTSRFVAEVLPALPPDATVLTEWADGCVLIYEQKVRGIRPDVRIHQALDERGLRQFVEKHPGMTLYRTAYPLTPRELPSLPGHFTEVMIPDTLWRISTTSGPR